ncbi:MAG: 50S ribosomal protein L4, partial [Patescibacteria group bacterium]
DHFIAMDELTIEGGKTSQLVKALAAMKIDGRRSLLMVVDSKNTAARRAASNIPKVRTIAPNSLNVNDLLRSGYVMAGVGEIKTIETTYGSAR